MVITHVKRAFKYRFHPTDAQANELLRTFGCVRGVAPTTVTISRDTADRWFVSMLLSTGEKVGNPRHGSADRARLAMAQRKLARKDVGSSNRDKARRVVARIHARIADCRRDHLHKLTTRLVRDNQTLVIEDLAVRSMVQNRRLARAISDASWAEFRSMVEYKAARYGREVIAVNRFFPSSKLCSRCGALRSRMPLSVRIWTCACGATRDRDVNAARNLLAAGLAVSVCGAGVRPQRNSSARAVGGETESPPA